MRISDWSSDVCSSDLDWSSVRSLIYGAAPISDSLLRKAMRALQCDFIQIYGMTEHCGCVALLPPEDHDPERKAELLASCGKPLPEIGTVSRRARVCQYV